MNLSTRYLGLDLPHPFMPGASPMVDDLDTVRRLEDAGAAAIVMHSLFEEQIEREQLGVLSALETPQNSFSEAGSFLPEVDEFALGPEEYLEQLRLVREAVSVPVIGSLNGTDAGRWLDYAGAIESAGADALELNIYHVATDPAATSELLERQVLRMVEEVRSRISIPVAVKLSPFYTALAHFARRLDQAGAAGLVLFNRFYQPDVDLDEIDVDRRLVLSDPTELPLRLRWLAVLHGRIDGSLAVTGGVHRGADAIKAVLCGADAVQMVSALLKWGPEHLDQVRRELEQWLQEHEYESLQELRGALSLERCPDPAAFERANYMQMLQSLGGLGF